MGLSDDLLMEMQSVWDQMQSEQNQFIRQMLQERYQKLLSVFRGQLTVESWQLTARVHRGETRYLNGG